MMAALGFLLYDCDHHIFHPYLDFRGGLRDGDLLERLSGDLGNRKIANVHL